MENKDYKKSSRLLLIVTAFFWMATYTYPSYLTPHLESIGTSFTMAGYIVGSYGFTQMILRFPLGILSGKTGKLKYYVLLGLGIAGISSAGLAFSSNEWLILLFRALAGVAASFWVQISSLYISYFSNEESNSAVSRINFTQNIGTISATFLGSQMIFHFGMKEAFLLGGVFAAIGLVFAFFLEDIQEKSTTNPLKDASSQLQEISQTKQHWFSSRLLVASGLAAITQAVNFATVQGFVPQYAKSMEANSNEIGILATASHMARAVAVLVAGQYLIRRYTARKQILFTTLVNAVLVLTLPFIKNFPLLFVHQIVSAACMGVQISYFMAHASKGLPVKLKSTAMGFFQAVYGIGMVLGPALVGYVSDISKLEIAFVLIGLIACIGFILSVFFFREEEPVA